MSIPKAELHTAEELLQGAEFLAGSDNPAMLRAAVLEAFSALETYVQDAVFATLDRSIYSPLAAWLKNELEDRLDKRLSLLESVVVRKPMDKQIKVDFQRAKNIRNAVTHAGKRVSAPDARFVIQTVYKVLAYLGSTLELELALIGLKRYIQEQQISVKTDEDAVSVVSDYFGRIKAAYSYTELPRIESKRGRPKLEWNLVLEFGSYRVLVATKFVHANENRYFFGFRFGVRGDTATNAGFQPVFRDLVDDLHGALNLLELRQGVIVFFVNGHGDTQICPSQRRGRYQVVFGKDEDEKIKTLESIQKYHDDTVYAIAIDCA